MRNTVFFNFCANFGGHFEMAVILIFLVVNSYHKKLIQKYGNFKIFITIHVNELDDVKKHEIHELHVQYIEN